MSGMNGTLRAAGVEGHAPEQLSVRSLLRCSCTQGTCCATSLRGPHLRASTLTCITSKLLAHDPGQHLTLTPIGLPMPRMNSTCAPSSCRVRSPHHKKWPLQSYL
jgi:hypothetical protein